MSFRITSYGWKAHVICPKDGDFKAFVSSESASQLIISALKSIGNGIELSSQAVYYVGNLFADAARQR